MSLIITGVLDGPLSGGVPKLVELYATEAIADLSAYGLGSANNGGGTDGVEFTFPTGSLAQGSYIYIASQGVADPYLGITPDYATGALSVNGDDAIELFKDGAVIDLFGDPDTDGTGQVWEYLDGWAYRNPGSVASPTFDIAQWTFSGPNALDGETANSTAATPFPIGSYDGSGASEPSDPTDGGGEEPTITKISEIQGASSGGVVGVDDVSPLAGKIVTISAIVTADFQDPFGGGLGGFYVQEQEIDYDFSDLTSEGIFIFDRGSSSPNVAVGDWVQVTGKVIEFFGETQIQDVTVEVIESGVELPKAVSVEFPVATVMETGGQGNYVADLEAYEGMRISISQDMTVSEMFNLDRFGQYNVSADGRPLQFTQTNAPNAEGYDAHLRDVASRKLVLDDGSTTQNPDPLEIIDGNDGVLTAEDSFRMGDAISDISGIVSYSFGEFRIHDATGTYEGGNPRPEAPEDIGGNFKVASLNVLNYFTTLDENGNRTDNDHRPRGADNAAEFERQAGKLVNAIIEMDADVLGLLEIENDFAGDSFAIKDLVDRVNAVLGAEVYAFADPGQATVGGDAIANALIYKIDSVALRGDMAILTEHDGRNFLDPLGAGRDLNRAAIAQSFEDLDTGQLLTVSVNHLKSKGSESGLAVDEDQGDGQGNNNATRTEAAKILADWLESDPTGQAAANTLILGDLNAYAKEDPLTALAEAGYVDLAAAELGDEAYSYVFDGQAGTLDYALANQALAAMLAGVTEWHINADEADALDYNLDFRPDPSLYDGDSAARNSDHDPVIVSFDFETVYALLEGSKKSDRLHGTDGRDEIDAGRGNDRLFGHDHEDLLRGGDGNDRLYGGDGDDRLLDGAGNDLIFGGNGDDWIEIGGGRNDRARGGDGADTFKFSAEMAADGQWDKTKLLDYDAAEDMIHLGGADISGHRTRGDGVVLELEGGKDQIWVAGVSDLNEIVFVEDHLFV